MVNFATTLAPQAQSSFNLEIGTLASDGLERLTSDAPATLNLNSNIFNDVFFFQTDSHDFSNNQSGNTDLQFACDSTITFTGFNPSAATVLATHIVDTGVTAENKPIKQDVANWCVRLLLGTGAADLLSNETELVNDIEGLDATFRTSIQALLAANGGTTNLPRTNDVLTGGNLDSVSSQANNYARQVLLSGLQDASGTMLDRINTLIADENRDATVFLPINFESGDTLTLYVVYGSNNALFLDTDGSHLNQINTANSTSYENSLASSNSLFPNNSSPHNDIHDGIVASAKAWRVYKIVITFV